MDRADHRLHGDCHPHSSWYYLLHGNPVGVKSEEVLYRQRFCGGLSPYYIYQAALAKFIMLDYFSSTEDCHFLSDGVVVNP